MVEINREKPRRRGRPSSKAIQLSEEQAGIDYELGRLARNRAQEGVPPPRGILAGGPVDIVNGQIVVVTGQLAAYRENRQWLAKQPHPEYK